MKDMITSHSAHVADFDTLARPTFRRSFVMCSRSLEYYSLFALIKQRAS